MKSTQHPPRILKLGSLWLLSGLACLVSNVASAGTITPDIIWGSGNTNRGFTVTTSGSLELGLRAKQRYSLANDEIGVGIVQDTSGNYIFDSSGATIPSNRSFWNFDWSINSDTEDGSTRLDAYTYNIAFDTDPTASIIFGNYDPLSAISTGYYLGNNNTGNGAASFQSGGDEDFSAFNIAQNSVNMGFLGGPLGAGEFRVSLSASQNGQEVASTYIDVFVDTPASVPAPATLALMGLGLAGLGWKRRKQA